MDKVYLRATGDDTFKWVDKPSKATADYKGAMQVTLKQFRRAKLERAPKKSLQHEPGWIISTKAKSR
jgi:hypothetical protein